VSMTLRYENDTRPRLEYYPANSPTLRTVVVEEFPFIIGRGESAQLQIKSESISRAHAELTRTTVGYRLRDLNSTNGTAVNGQPVSEAVLEDGDSISIAEIELTFICSGNAQFERMATQPLLDKRKIDPVLAATGEMLAARELSAALLWQAIPLNRTCVIDCQSKSERVTMVSVGEPLASRLHATDAFDPCSTASRIQQLAWQLTAEHANQISHADSILMRVELQSGLDDRLFVALDQAFDCLTGSQSLGIVLPWAWAVQSPDSLALCAEFKELGADLAFDRFSGGPTCIGDVELASPDLLVLAPELARGISSHPRRMMQLKHVVSNCDAADVKVVLPAGLPEEDFQAASDVGVNLIIGSVSTCPELNRSTALPVTA
jgi:pSer/pThr/pTyr-binding forkhead associated (FHA) protein